MRVLAFGGAVLGAICILAAVWEIIWGDVTRLSSAVTLGLTGFGVYTGPSLAKGIQTFAEKGG